MFGARLTYYNIRAIIALYINIYTHVYSAQLFYWFCTLLLLFVEQPSCVSCQVYLFPGWRGEIIGAGSKPLFLFLLSISYLLLLLFASVLFMSVHPPASSGCRALESCQICWSSGIIFFRGSLYWNLSYKDGWFNSCRIILFSVFCWGRLNHLKKKEKQCPLDVYCMQKSDVVVEIA